MKILEGVKVVEFGWAIVGPMTTQFLAEYGAEVIKIESSSKPDSIRLMSPFKDDEPGLNRSGFWASSNTGKYSVSLNLSHPKGLRLAKRIATRADIVVDSFTSGVMAKWGLAYEDLKEVKPDIIMLSSCMFGQTGPVSKMPGYGGPLTAISGISSITGWPDRLPSGPYGAYTDYVAPRFNAFALLAALQYKKRTGKGQHLDISQYEAALHFVTPIVLDYIVNRRVLLRMGNRSNCAAPHGVYRCQGQDRWCAIAISTHEEWKSFCQVIGNPAWTKDPDFSTLQGRLEAGDKLDRLLEDWTLLHSPEEVMALMQAAGVPAGVLESGEDLDHDPQLNHRGHYRELDHPEMGRCRFRGQSILLTRFPRAIKRSPCLGEHTDYVMTRLLDLSDEEFAKLMSEGVFE